MEKKRLTRIRNGFSDRNNLSSLPKKMQYKKFNKETIIRFKNLSFDILQDYIDNVGNSRGKTNIIDIFADEAFCVEVHGSNIKYEDIINKIKQVFDEGTYYEILDIIEFIASKLHIDKPPYPYPFYVQMIPLTYYDSYNSLFEQEYVGYRFVKGFIVRITDKAEIESISDAASTPYKKINEHIDKAIKYISEKGNKDYKNSIKESITALEACCSIVTGDSKELSATIKFIGQKKKLHPALVSAITKLYGFASDEPGVRHENNKEESDINFEEAKLILVICSGLINYFVYVFKGIADNVVE